MDVKPIFHKVEEKDKGNGPKEEKVRRKAEDKPTPERPMSVS